MKVQAAITDGKGKLEIGEVEISDTPVENEVLVDIKASGVCHTDWDALKWGPSVLGHEGAGVVRAVGPDVTTVKPGDRVVLNWVIACGQCFQCLRGNHTRCEDKKRAPRKESTLHRGAPLERSFFLGTLSSVAIVREPAVTRIDVKIPMTSACLLGCGVMTGYGSAVNVAQVRPGESVVVIGAGGVGLSAIQGARIANAGIIIAVDINPKNLELAKRFGATHLIQAERGDTKMKQVIEQVRALTGGRGTDYAFECSGVPALSVVPPLEMVRARGEAYLLSNIEHDVAFSMLYFTGDRSYMRPTYGWCRPDVDFPTMLNFYDKKQLYLDEMVTNTYSLEQLPRAFEDMFAGKNARGVVVFP